MHRAAAILVFSTLATPAFGDVAMNVREYAERCADYYARQYEIQPALVRAVIRVESNWNPGATSPKGAMGLMQLMPATARRFGVANPFFIDENVRAGVAYLAELKGLFHGDLRLILAAYIAGEKALLRRGLAYSSREVYRYVKRVAQQYRNELQQEARR